MDIPEASNPRRRQLMRRLFCRQASEKLALEKRRKKTVANDEFWGCADWVGACSIHAPKSGRMMPRCKLGDGGNLKGYLRGVKIIPESKKTFFSDPAPAN